MSELIYDSDDVLLPWAQDRIGVTFGGDARGIGLKRNGEIVAVAVYEKFSSFDCVTHIASDGTKAWLNKAFLLAMFAYPFTQLGLRRITGLVPAKNLDALKFDENLGFVREGYHPHCAKDDDLISLGMLRENCRFIPQGEHNGNG